MAISAKSKKEYVSLLKEKLASSDLWAVRGLMAIYDYQTDYELRQGHTIEFNGVGFSGKDSEILTSFAEQFEKNGRLSEKQMSLLKRLMPRYAGQLLEHCLARGTVVKKDGSYRNNIS